MKKSQFFILFSLIFSFFLLIFYFKDNRKDYIEQILILQSYFEKELSYLSTLNCSFRYETILDFINKTGFNVRLIYYFDNCEEKIISFYPYKEKLLVKEYKDFYEICLNNKCRDLPKIGKRFCIVYELKNKVFFKCF
ncbi:MAG TPA: hypothetical protein EYH54_04005 [Nautiliaceae bacterium]|nr:hypothetical protein [Nautiliaceae bacterium]